MELVRSYAHICKHYLKLKRKPWKEFVQYYSSIEDKFSLPKEGIVIDVGAGNGRNLLIFKETMWETVALDLSLELLKGINNSQQLGCSNIINADIISLPFRTSISSLVLCIAVIHHLKSKDEVIEALNNIAMILKDEGYLILSCLRRWKRDTIYVMFRDLILFPLLKLKDFSWRHGDYYLPWHNREGKIVTKRYYHLFTRRELITILKKTQFEICDLTIMGGKKGRDNFFLLLKKNRRT